MRKRTPSIPMSHAVAVGLAVGAIYLGWVYPALPHDAPMGWKYPFACCSNADCREIGSRRSTSKVQVAETPVGYKVNTTGEVVGYSDPRIRESPDGEFHICTVAGADDSRVLCLFVPPRSF